MYSRWLSTIPQRAHIVDARYPAYAKDMRAGSWGTGFLAGICGCVSREGTGGCGGSPGWMCVLGVVGWTLYILVFRSLQELFLSIQCRHGTYIHTYIPMYISNSNPSIPTYTPPLLLPSPYTQPPYHAPQRHHQCHRSRPASPHRTAPRPNTKRPAVRHRSSPAPASRPIASSAVPTRLRAREHRWGWFSRGSVRREGKGGKLMYLSGGGRRGTVACR